MEEVPTDVVHMLFHLDMSDSLPGLYLSVKPCGGWRPVVILIRQCLCAMYKMKPLARKHK